MAESKKVGPHMDESLKYAVIITTIVVIGALVLAIAYSYSYPPFGGQHKNKNVVRSFKPVPSEYVNDINLVYPNRSTKDMTKPDAYDENYTETVDLIGTSTIPEDLINGSIPNNYKDFF